MKPSLIASLLIALCVAGGARATGSPPAPWAGARQMVLVVSADWDASTASLARFERASDGSWQRIGEDAPVTLGRAGSAWGLGLHGDPPGPRKREGDGRAPAGVFALGPAFGYAAGEDTALEYRAMRASHWCIDVPASPLYNRIVDADEVGIDAIAGSTEPMRRDLHADGDQRYRRGFVIEHNGAAVAGGGSCIFAHLWKAPGEATAGCTAMADATMDVLLRWLDPAQAPVFVLLPQAEYRRRRETWDLPAITADQDDP